MKRDVLMAALGKGGAGDEEIDESPGAVEMPEEEEETDVDAEVTAFFNEDLPMAERIAAFRAAVSGCMKGY